MPNFLGLLRSTDGGKTWTAVSRLADADLHKIVLRHDRLYAFDAVLSAMLTSTDGGKTFKEEFTPRGLMIDFEVDPADPERMVASLTRAVSDRGRRTLVAAADRRRGDRLSWPEEQALYRADKDGTVRLSSDGGTRWRDVGRVGGEPYELRATGPNPVPRVRRWIDPRDDRRRRHVARPLPALIPAAGVAALLPAGADAHSLVRTGGNELAYLSSDAVSLNTLVVKRSGATSTSAPDRRRRPRPRRRRPRRDHRRCQCLGDPVLGPGAGRTDPGSTSATARTPSILQVDLPVTVLAAPAPTSSTPRAARTRSRATTGRRDPGGRRR